MSQAGSAMLGSGSQSCPVMAKTDNAQSIINILTAIHLKRDIVRHALPARGAAAAARPPARPPSRRVRRPTRFSVRASLRTAVRSPAPAGRARRALTCRGVGVRCAGVPVSLCVVRGRRRTA